MHNTGLPSGKLTGTFSPESVCYREEIRGGMGWSMVVKRGFALRLTALADNANVALLAFNARQPLDRYNMPDTLKAQHTFLLTAGHILYSDMGHALLSIIHDDCGWHDTVCGVSTRDIVQEKYGAGSYQQLRNDWHRSGRELLLVELGKHGLGRRDLVANVNLFSKVAVDSDGNLQFAANHSKGGNVVDLRADMDVLVVLATVQHVLDPSPDYAPVGVTAAIWQCGVAGDDDICRKTRQENVRGLDNTARCFYHQHQCQHHQAMEMQP
jgi:urea carboxylase-associated protein 2